MSTEAGRNMYRDTRNPQPTPPLDTAALRRSAIARGRAAYAARGDRDVRAALANLEDEDDTPPPAAA